MMFDRRDYSVIPVRACHMVKRAQSWRVLAALGNYASGWGLCYPAQRTHGELTGNMDQGDVSRATGGGIRSNLLRRRRSPVGVRLPWRRSRMKLERRSS